MTEDRQIRPGAVRLQALLAGRSATRSTIPRRTAPGVPQPLSHSQRRLYLLTQLLAEPGVYNSYFALRLQGALDEARLARALDAIVARHEILRTTYRVEGDA